jgi:quinol monooxygenase YgiN
MKTILVIATAITAAGPWGMAPREAAPAGIPPTSEHEWLLKLEGEWHATIEASLGPDTEPVRAEQRETIRSIGGLWVLAESIGDNNGTPMSSLFTLGYDTANKRFVGCWVDSVQTHLWTYTGQLDESKAVLTLEAEGPPSGNPTISKYRVVITLKGPDHKVVVSSIEVSDGRWFEYVTADYRRTVSTKTEKPRSHGEEGEMYGLIGKVVAAPGRREELVEVLLAGTKNMPGCLSYVVAKDEGNVDALWVTEVWDSQESHEASLELPAVQHAMARGRPAIAGFGERFVTVPLGGHGLLGQDER